MEQNTKALYAGSFDPPTNGHLAVIEAGAHMFNEVEVAVGVNPAKRYTFTVPEREEMLQVITSEFDNVAVGSYTELLIEYASRNGFTHILRGIRSAVDLDSERALQIFNEQHEPEIQTVYIPCRKDVEIVSSSMVKSLVGATERWEDYAAKYVDGFVLDALVRNLQQRTSS